MRKYWLILVLPVLLLLWWGLDDHGSAPLVHFTKVARTRIESTVSTNGKVEPAEWAAARAEAPGVVRKISVQRGQSVTAGQALVYLDTTAARSDLAEAQAKEQEAQAEGVTVAQGGKAATLADLNGRIRTGEATVDAAQRTFDSLSRLAGQQAATPLQVQNARDALEQAKLQLAALEDQRKTLVTNSDKAVAQAKLKDAQAGVTLAQHRIALGDISAPISGTVYQFDLKIGAYMQPGDLVALVGNLDQVKVTVYVDEPELGRVAEHDPVSITWDARPGLKWWGQVDKLPTEVIALGTRTVGEVTTIVNNPNHDLLPGVTVNATIVSKVVDGAISIPKAALRRIQGASGVYQLQGSSLAWTPVRTGVSDVNRVQILAGLVPGAQVVDRVIEPADAEIRNGMHVRPVTD